MIVGAYLVQTNGALSGNASVFSLPCPPSDPVTMIGDLMGDVITLNLSNGIENSLDAKLDAAFNALQAFINAVAAQSGNRIEVADAIDLIAAAQEIIDMLTGG